MATIKFNISNDAVTGKKMKYTNQEVRMQYGIPIEFIGTISLHEVNNDPAIPAGTDERSKRTVSSYTENFSLVNKHIDSVTKLYAYDVNGTWMSADLVTPVPNAVVSLSEFFETKAINTFPQVAGADPLWSLIEGLCKEMIGIRKTNGEFPA